MKGWLVGLLPEGAAAVGYRMLFDMKQLSGRYESRLAALISGYFTGGR